VTEPLPNVTFDFGRNFAGNLPVQRGHNLSLFYWAVEKEAGSLTAGTDDTTSPWQIWLNGGPGSSSLVGFFFEVSALISGPCLR
jgi:carboxypeptidase D